MIINGYILSVLYAALCIVLACAAHKLGMPKKYSRKIVHILVFFEWFILSYYMGTTIHFAISAAVFTLALLVEYRLKLMPAMSSDGGNAPGTVYYAAVMTALALISHFLPSMLYPFGIAVLCISFGDGLAGVVGQSVRKHNLKIKGEKTLLGTLVNFLVSSLLPLAFSALYSLDLSLIECVMIGLLSAGVELLCSRGLDNIFVTLSVAAFSFLLINEPRFWQISLAVAMIPLVAAIASEKRALSYPAIALAAVLGLASSLAFGNRGFLLLIIYFTLSLITDKIKKTHKKSRQNKSVMECKLQKNEVSEPVGEPGKEKKLPHRKAHQVIANGLAAFISAALFLVVKKEIFAIAFVISLGESLSDTAASGIGALSKSTYDPFRFKPAVSGESGAVSAIGTAAALIAAAAFASIAYALGLISLLGAVFAASAAFIGNVIDSLIGSLFQAKYLCSLCGRRVEAHIHCAHPTRKISGFRFINNSTTNLISNLLSATLALLLLI